jgi:hypothetical protein
VFKARMEFRALKKSYTKEHKENMESESHIKQFDEASTFLEMPSNSLMGLLLL